MIRQLVDKIYYVGVNDRQKDLFENMLPLQYGVSYNAYLINDDKTVLVDTVEHPFVEQLIDQVKIVLNGKNWIISLLTIWNLTILPVLKH